MILNFICRPMQGNVCLVRLFTPHLLHAAKTKLPGLQVNKLEAHHNVIQELEGHLCLAGGGWMKQVVQQLMCVSRQNTSTSISPELLQKEQHTAVLAEN